MSQLWGNADKRTPTKTLRPSDYGWKDEENGRQPVWYEGSWNEGFGMKFLSPQGKSQKQRPWIGAQEDLIGIVISWREKTQLFR